MKRIIMFAFVWAVIFGLLIAPMAFSQNNTSGLDRPTFNLPHCYLPSLLSQPVCMTQDYLQDEFYVVLKNKPENSANFAFGGYQISALQTAVNRGSVNEYHNELQRIEALSTVSPAVKDLAAQTTFDRILHIKVKNPDDFNRTLFQFSQDPGVESISLSSVVHTTDLPYNDPLAKEQYSLPMIKAIETHAQYGFGSPLAIIAVFDTGGTTDHPDLIGKYGWEYTAKVSPFPKPDDRFGHGTHVAGIAGAIVNNKEGIVGNCPECTLWSIKVLNDGGSGAWDWITDGVLAAVSKLDEVQKQNPLASATFNFSLAGNGPIPTVDAAFAVAYKKDVVIVAAAGNNGFKIGPGGEQIYPASSPGVVVAEAVDSTRTLASFSNYGPKLISGECPGVDIISTVPTSGNISDKSGYLKASGTSMAAPCMAGAIAHTRGTAARQGRKISRELINGMILGAATIIPGHDQYSASGGVVDMLSLHDIPLTPPGPVTDFGVFGTNWGSSWIAFTSVSDSLGKPPIGFLVSYSKKSFNESSINRADVTTIRYNIKRGAGEGANLRIENLDPETHYYITVRVLDRAFNISPLPANGVLQFTTQKASVFPGAKWTFTTADGKKDPSGFVVDKGPIAWFFELFFDKNQLLWHLSDIISNFKDFRWNWWFGNPGTLGYKTPTYSDALVISPVVDLTNMHYGAELTMDYFQQLLSTVAQAQDEFVVYAVILDENNRPVEPQDKNAITLFQNTGKTNNSKALRMTPIRMDLGSVKDVWLEDQKNISDGSLDRFHVVFAFEFLSITVGQAGGIGSIFGNLAIMQNP